MDKELPVSVWPEWRIIEKIGEGSFGRVYKAERCEQGKTFYSAIKIITIPASQSELNSVRSETADENSAREYFHGLMEECIQEVSTMEHFRGNSHVVSVEDFKVVEYLDVIGWDIYIRMEYLTSFMDYCTEKSLSEKEVIQLGVDLCKALEHCRQLNIIHRDIKPENIFVSRFGEFKIGDFGIARELERTMSGFSKKGTYSYMAPEMYRGEQYDNRVDIYSLGIVLYKLTNNNRLPFINLEKQLITYRDKENALARRMSGEALSKPAGAGDEFSLIILKACAYKPEERYQDAGEFRQDLEDLQRGILPQAVIGDLMSAGRENGSGSEAASQLPQRPSPENWAAKAAPQLPQQPSPENRAAKAIPRNVQMGKEISQGQNADVQKKISDPPRRPTAVRRKKKKKKLSPWTIAVLVVAVAACIITGVYIKLMLDDHVESRQQDMVQMMEGEGYSEDGTGTDEFTQALQEIKNHATTIVNELNTYSWQGMEGDLIYYSDPNNNQLMKALIYPAQSEDNVFEEYYYWNEELFFAYIWENNKEPNLYYYNEGTLIRWIDEQKVCHDNETDNSEYLDRGDKYLNNAEKHLLISKSGRDATEIAEDAEENSGIGASFYSESSIKSKIEMEEVKNVLSD